MGENKLCFGCMENKGNSSVCPNCGYRDNTPYLLSYIAPGTTLNDRYLVGKLINHNGEGATYIAYDTVLTCKVLIREYMPETLCSRVKNTPVINVNQNSLAQYKALMAEFTELNKSIAKMRGLNHINPAIDIFAENNTSYAVYEYLDGFNLIEFLRKNAGELNWEEVTKLFPPLFTTLSLIHNAGIIHRGISPETVYYTSKGELKLFGFCISAVRTANSELNSELFTGYAAPEQYSLNTRQGNWTDVYGICALLYRILTGCMPNDAQSRISNDTLCPPNDINPNVPKRVSNVIMEGMRVDGNQRIQTITELVTKLFEQPENIDKNHTNIISTATIAVPIQKINNTQSLNNTSYIDDDYYDEDDDYYDDSEEETIAETVKQKPFDRIKVPLMIGVLVLAILMVIAVIVLGFFENRNREKETYGIYYSSSLSDNIETIVGSETEELNSEDNAVKDSQMPYLIGKSYDELKSESTLEGWLTLDPVYEYNETYEKGVIFEQAVDSGEWVSSKTPIKVKISLGTSYIPVPEYYNKKHSAYLQELDELGIKYEEAPEVNYSYYTGYVTRTSIPPGEIINVKEATVLIVYYAENDWSNSNNWENTTTTQKTTTVATTTTTEYVPPKTEAPVTNPPATDPPVTEPPVTEPPATNPPATDPPTTDANLTTEPQ